jgi:hypothetical protein
VSDEARRIAGEAWAFRARVEWEAAKRFQRLAAAIAEFDGSSPLPASLASAAEDEERHAALCARLSAAYGRPASAPAPEPASIAPRDLAPRDAVLYEMVAACCITETESVATLATLLSGDVAAEVRSVLHEIARDEVGHSRLGWAHLAREAAVRDVRFLSERIPSMLQGTVDDGLFAPARAGEEPAGLVACGVLPRLRKREIFVSTLQEVVFAGLEALGLDGGPARAWLAARI